MFYKIINSLVNFAREKTNIAINIYLFCLVVALLFVGIVSMGSGPIKTMQTDLIVPESVKIEEELLNSVVDQIKIREENFSKISEVEYQNIFNTEEETTSDNENAEVIEDL